MFSPSPILFTSHSECEFGKLFEYDISIEWMNYFLTLPYYKKASITRHSISFFSDNKDVYHILTSKHVLKEHQKFKTSGIREHYLLNLLVEKMKILFNDSINSVLVTTFESGEEFKAPYTFEKSILKGTKVVTLFLGSSRLFRINQNMKCETAITDLRFSLEVENKRCQMFTLDINTISGYVLVTNEGFQKEFSVSVPKTTNLKKNSIDNKEEAFISVTFYTSEEEK